MSEAVFAYVVENWLGFLEAATPGSHMDDFVWPFEPADAVPLAFENKKLTVLAAGDVYTTLAANQTQLVAALQGFAHVSNAEVEVVEVPPWAVKLAGRLNHL